MLLFCTKSQRNIANDALNQLCNKIYSAPYFKKILQIMLQINFAKKFKGNQDFQNAMPFRKTNASYDIKVNCVEL